MAGDCLGRTPFASLIACILTCIGVGLFAGTQFRAIDIVLRRIFEGLFLFPVPWLESIQIAFVIIAVVMGLYSFILLAFGFLATGATRQNIYSGAQCIMGGRVSAGFFMVLTYILNLCWIAMTGFLCMCIIIWIMLTSICINEIENRELWYYENYCLNLSRFGIYRNFTEGLDKNALCDETELGEFCQHVRDSLPMFILAAIGSTLIVIGMLNFLISFSSNYQKIKLSKELTEYRSAVDLELTEEIQTVSKRPDHRAFAKVFSSHQTSSYEPPTSTNTSNTKPPRPRPNMDTSYNPGTDSTFDSSYQSSQIPAANANRATANPYTNYSFQPSSGNTITQRQSTRPSQSGGTGSDIPSNQGHLGTAVPSQEGPGPYGTHSFQPSGAMTSDMGRQSSYQASPGQSNV